MHPFSGQPISFSHPMLAPLKLENNHDAFGFISCSPDTDYQDMIRTLKESLPLTMVGGTSLGDPFDNSGDAFGTSMAFVGKKGVKTATAVSMPITGDNSAEVMTDLYTRCSDVLGEPAKLFLVFLPLVPDLFMDSLVGELFRLANGVPVFGTMVSTDFNSDRFAVFANGESYGDRIAMVALAGNIRPVFGVGQESTVPSDYAPIVTEAEGNVIRTVDGIPFGEYLKKYDIDASSLEEFPIIVRMFGPDGDSGDQRLTILVKIGDDNEGILGNTVRVGDGIGLGYLSRENIEKSTSSCLEQLTSAMRKEEKTGYRFDIILAVSCASRYYAGGSHLLEADMLNAALPDGTSTFGMYGYGEICPVIDESGVANNRQIRQALVMCAF